MDSIANLELRIRELKSLPHTKLTKSQIDLLKTNINKIYVQNKNQILQYEKTNYDHLALIRSTNGFYKMFDHSALFYAENIAKKLGLDVSLQNDHDFCEKAANGFVSIRNVNTLTQNLCKLNITGPKADDKDLVFFKLPWTYTETQLQNLLVNNQLNRRNFNHIVLVENPIPVLFINATELLKATYETTRNFPGPYERDVFGKDLVNFAKSITLCYLKLGNGDLNKLTALKNIQNNLKLYKYHLKIVADLGIMPPRSYSRIAETIKKISLITERELKRPNAV